MIRHVKRLLSDFNQYPQALRKKCSYSELFLSAFVVILLRISPYSAQMRENVDQNNSEYGDILRSEKLLVRPTEMILTRNDKIYL